MGVSVEVCVDGKSGGKGGGWMRMWVEDGRLCFPGYSALEYHQRSDRT